MRLHSQTLEMLKTVLVAELAIFVMHELFYYRFCTVLNFPVNLQFMSLYLFGKT